jgi:hypothetical protein
VAPATRSVTSTSTDPKAALLQMSGFPQPVGDLPRGTVAVRVIAESPANVANHQIEIRMTRSGRRVRSVTDKNGHAVFTGLAPGDMVQARATVGGETIASQQFTLPRRGGVRLVLVAGNSARATAARTTAGGTTWNVSTAAGQESSLGSAPDSKTAFLLALGAAFVWLAASIIWPRRRRSASWQTK